MNKTLNTLLLITTLSFNCYSQIAFENGYFITNSGQEITCLIKNTDSKFNPTEFTYKLTENAEQKKATINNVKEFGIYNTSKFIRNTVKIDKSSENVINLSKDRNPLFKEEQLFLKVLIEGKANLYFYRESGLKRFFYKKGNTNPEQLVFKKYVTSDDKLSENNYFKQQLWKDLKCSSITIKKIEALKYEKTSLINLFTNYNNCSKSNITIYDKKEKKDLFNLTFRPRLNNTSLSIENKLVRYRNVNFGSELGLGFGIEVEFILPFNKNKWAIAIEPTYQYFKSEKKHEAKNVSGGTIIWMIDYNSIEIPFSLRHYLFLNNNSKIFVDVSYVLDFALESSIVAKRGDNSILFSNDNLEPQSNFAFGIGYKFNNKYSFEMRYQTAREILGNFAYESSNYKTLSIILGYSIF